MSELLALHHDVLAVLVEHGFSPLAQKHLRKLLAPTVTLAQAVRLRSLTPESEEALLGALAALLVEPRQEAVASPAGADRRPGAACR